eukprot:7387584-Prymnesium_polylepis.1
MVPKEPLTFSNANRTAKFRRRRAAATSMRSEPLTSHAYRPHAAKRRCTSTKCAHRIGQEPSISKRAIESIRSVAFFAACATSGTWTVGHAAPSS